MMGQVPVDRIHCNWCSFLLHHSREIMLIPPIATTSAAVLNLKLIHIYYLVPANILKT